MSTTSNEISSVCEERVFLQVHENHAVSLRNFLFYKFGSLEKARDCTQDAFMTLWNNCKKVSFDKAKSYLFTVANRLFLDAMAHEKVRLKFEVRTTAKEARLESNPEYQYLQEEFKDKLEAAISSLPERQRTVFLLSRIDKIPNQEIADTLDIGIKAVEKNITSALKNLRLKLEELENIKL